MTRAADLTRWLSVSVILFSALARVFSSPSRIPYWDIDPLTSWTPDTTRTPAMSLLFDALVWLAASTIIWAEGRAGRGIAWKTGLLALIGCIGVALHGWVLTPLVAIGGKPPTHGDFESMILGSSWASAIIGAWALSMAGRDAGVKRTAGMLLLGVVIVLGAKGAIQVFIEHPRLVADFNEKKDEMLAAQGFQPGSVSARLFERRLVQAEATGWFGLSNVYGSIMAAGCAGFLAFAIGGARAAKQKTLSGGEAGLLWIVAALAVMGLALSGSKGAIGAGMLGCLCVLVAHASSLPVMQRLLRWAPIALPIVALLAVIIRGMFGERIGELSLYFRWQYLLAAARIIVAHPIFGTGPAGFKDQYLLHKEPTNPEEIDSPHCLPMDWLATMGIFGAAWVILWVAWLWRADEPRAQARGLPPHPLETPCLRAGLVVPLTIFASLGFSWWAEWAAMLPEMLAVHALAGLVWWLVARTGSRLAEIDPRSLSIALFGAAIVLGTHCMIEVTGVLASSVGWVALIVALSSAKDLPLGSAMSRRAIFGVVVCSIGFCWLLFSAVRQVTIEGVLWQAAQEARSIEAPDGSFDTDAADRTRSTLMSLSDYSNRWPFNSRLYPDVENITSRLRWRIVLAKWSSDSGMLASESQMLIYHPPNWSRSFQVWSRHAWYAEARAALIARPEALPYAARVWQRITTLDPHGLAPPLHLARLYAQLDQPDEAARWARRALEVHANLRLDPLKGLTEAEKAEMERLAAE